MSQRDRIQTTSGTITIASGDTTASTSVYLNGLVRAIYVNIPEMTGTTVTFTLTGATSDFVLFNNGSTPLNAGQVTVIVTDPAVSQALQVPVDGICTITLTSNGTEAADRAISFSLLVDRGTM